MEQQQKPESIGEIISRNPLKPELPSSSLPDHVCDCGTAIEPFGAKIGGRAFYPPICKVCGVKRDAEIESRKLRRRRRTLQSHYRQRLNTIIPELFRKAHIRHLSPEFRDKLLDLLNTPQGAFLYGKPGTGKSYAFCAIARKLIIAGYNVRRVVWERLTLDIRGTFDGGDITETGIIQPLIDCDVLILEDIGTSKSLNATESDFNLRVLLTIIDSRLEGCRPTWTTSNKSIKQLGESFDERIASRLSEHCQPLLVEGRDRRDPA